MSDLVGGEHPRPASQLVSPILRRHGQDAAAYCFRRCYECWPELDAHFGERGRHHVAEDAFWHLEHLDAAVEVGEPAIFADYADWLAGLLQARGIGIEAVAGAFGFLAEALEGVACPATEEAHRGELIAILRANQARLAPAWQPHDRVGPG